MAPRGRRPHPDILTPRQWEVLDFLREGLTDQQIADRLGIMLDGAKYHVSEILSKLGVVSREEAAAWQPAERTRGGRLAWGAFAAALLASAGAVVAVLAIGALRSGTGEEESGTAMPEAALVDAFADLGLSPPDATPVLTADQALILNSFATIGDLRNVTLNLTTYGAVLDNVYDELYEGADPIPQLTEDERTQVAWLLRFATIAGECTTGCPIGVNGGNATCRLGWAYVVEDDSPQRYHQAGLSRFGETLPDSSCDVRQVDSSLAVVLAARAGMSSERLLLHISVSESTYAEARRWIDGIEVLDPSVTPDTTVWVVNLSDWWGIGPMPTLQDGGVMSLPGPRCRVDVLLRQDVIQTVAIGGQGFPCSD